MEPLKSSEYGSFRTHVHPAKYGAWRNVLHGMGIAVVALAGLAWWTPRLYPGAHTEIIIQSEFSWDQITPSQSLVYHDCFDGFQCARLEVPMDYNRSDGQGRRFAIAITRLPAKVPVTDSRYGGAVLTNPGGPGGSGVAQVLVSGKALQKTVDSENDPGIVDPESASRDKYFDIIGFDPRGVNNTTPGFSCFPHLFAQRNWELQVAAEGTLGSAEDAFWHNWARSTALNTGCAANLSTPPRDGEEALGEHLNTPPVARDMLEIVERHGEWRAEQGLLEQRQQDHMHGYDPGQSIVARTRWQQGREKLLYWGRSYGTVLGSTFATMFPDRIHRAVLDAVVDADKYYFGEGPNAVEDADAIFDQFTRYCHAAGGDVCPFYVQGGPAAIKKAYLALEEALYNRSLPVPASATRGPEVVTWSDLKIILRIALYQPLYGFPQLAEIATELSLGSGAALADFKVGGRSPSCPSDQCLQAGPWSAECQVSGHNEAYSSTAILCADAEYLQDADEEEFKRSWASLQEDSAMLGDYWASLLMSCVGWKLKPKWKLTGPFAANTSHPLLFVSNTLDPVTPLRSARKMSENFPGSVLLQQDSEGTGELPPSGVVCKADVKPILGASPSTQEGGMSAEDQKLYKALMEDAQRVAIARLPL
ncbi:hypothetical protein ASPNIDRAFT_44868 [Aspergillus niger ATCC 1015]|uniref:Peptidase S33 tripeptidyl aminopeptidase-like C-terminal domain-containing protein n=1 Tax=Aspergillus niger (strain ATCC 1015 / CBS 113.46 / FGSC A1144 / LSHB Ac4 / NCTC 3858a / NRRL 328 / USDA 3528.7) TaxID=380704 RepID=G3XQ78_ASPNA|nr:hypothetical protein ASPNIDRAFT_44868 [Aspergillus niger ATCC 1015]